MQVVEICKIKNLKFSKIVFFLRPETYLSLPDFKGKTLRGGFGYAFKKIVCFSRVKKDCGECFLSDKCVYSLLFEGNFEGEKKWEGVKEVPKPFIIEPPVSDKKVYNSSEILKFNLVLIGKAINYFPYFFLAFSHLGEIGIGKDRKKFKIEKVEQIYPEERKIYEMGNDYIEKVEPGYYNPSKSETTEVKRINFNFLSPVRIKCNGRYISILEFHHLIRNLTRRISMLSFFWCNGNETFERKQLIEESKKVKIKRCNLRWVDYD